MDGCVNKGWLDGSVKQGWLDGYVKYECFNGCVLSRDDWMDALSTGS